MPKLFPPPFSAFHRSGCEVRLALMIIPEASTSYSAVSEEKGINWSKLTSAFTRRSQLHPTRGPNWDNPPRFGYVNVHVHASIAILKVSPPSRRPPTPTFPFSPPATARPPTASRWSYTSPHLAPEPICATE